MTPAPGPPARPRTRSSPASAVFTLYALVSFAGAAALSWEVLWQLEAALAIGVSAKGTAITLAASMGGMTIVQSRLLWERMAYWDICSATGHLRKVL